MDNSISRIITLLSRKSQSYIGSALSKYNLTAAEQPIFMTLRHTEGITQEELTALVSVDKAATARTVKSLEEKGFLIRVQDTQDRRRNRLFLTESAKQLEPTVRSEFFHFNELLTQGIDPQDLEIVYAALLKMEENVSRIAGRKSLKAEQGGLNDGTNK